MVSILMDTRRKEVYKGPVLACVVGLYSRRHLKTYQPPKICVRIKIVFTKACYFETCLNFPLKVTRSNSISLFVKTS